MSALLGFVGCVTTVATPDIPATVATAVEATIEAIPTPSPKNTPTPIPTRIPSRTPAPQLTAIPTPQPAQTPEGGAFYIDWEIDTFIQQFPALADPSDHDRAPGDVLQTLKIDTAALEAIDRYVGDCLCFIVYKLSPSYELVVDNDACSGPDVYVRKR